MNLARPLLQRRRAALGPAGLPQGVRVRAPARLHLGFLDLAGDLGRRFGSIGLSIEGYATRLTMTRAPRPFARRAVPLPHQP